MHEQVPAFRAPSSFERTFNRAFGAMVGLGLGPRDYYLLQVRGWNVRRFRLRAIPDIGKPSVLRAYLGRFKTTVQRYFPVPAGSPPEAFAAIAPRYPVFELLPLDHER
jgi:hypothetical protein